MNSLLKRASVLAVLLLAVAACDDDTTGMDDTEMGFGEPAEASEADRIIEVHASDDFAFDPDEMNVTSGETVTFRVINDGQLPHDFTLGDEATQDEHEEEMAETEGMAHDEPNAIRLEAGETKELTWRFTVPGTVLVGCHEPGHYAAGMRGSVTVES